MVKRNPHFAKLHSSYLFPEINKRKRVFLERNPDAPLISLGIGDTTEPIPPFIAHHLTQAARALGTQEGYSGYGAEQGLPLLRQSIAETLYQNRIEADEIFISDGSKCDIGRLQVLFGSEATLAVQDPSYPVYVDSGVILGQTEKEERRGSYYAGITYLPCHPENHFFPDLTQVSPTDLIYFCSPNNPTGAVATYEQLEELIAFARRHRSILIYDAAYACYIQEAGLPRSIYEIPGACEVAIELGSFSKMVGFTGVRLGWSVIPKELTFEGGYPLHADWTRMQTTLFNGASNIAQAGGWAALQPQGQAEMKELIRFYMENAKILKETLEELDDQVYGGTHAPYLWVRFPFLSSWEAFERLLEKAHLVTTPGSGFGPQGEGFIRLSAFGHRPQIEEAAERLRHARMYICSSF